MEDFELQDLCEKVVHKSVETSRLEEASNVEAIRNTNEMQGYVNVLGEMSYIESDGKPTRIVKEAEEDEDDDSDASNGGWVDRMNAGGKDEDEDDDEEEESNENGDSDDEEEEKEDDEESDDDEWTEENGSGVEIEVEASADMSKISDFGITLLMFATEVHFWHLNCDKNSIHVALQDLYEDCTDNADKILEAVIGITNKPCEPSMPDVAFGNLVYDEGCIDKIKKIRDTASELADSDNEGINNILGDVCESCDTAIYKLTRLT